MKLVKGLAVAAMMVMAVMAQAQYKEGQHYRVLENPSIPRDPSKIEVVEVFWYGCPHCFKLEPTVNAWKKSIQADVDFYQMPAQFSRRWKQHAELFYLTHALKVNDKAHEAIFNEIHVHKKPLLDKSAQKKFLKAYGVTEADFDKMDDSFSVRSQLKKADNMIRQHNISGVPAIIVNGKYFVDASTAGGQHKIFSVVDYLVEKERQAK